MLCDPLNRDVPVLHEYKADLHGGRWKCKTRKCSTWNLVIFRSCIFRCFIFLVPQFYVPHFQSTPPWHREPYYRDIVILYMYIMQYVLVLFIGYRDLWACFCFLNVMWRTVMIYVKRYYVMLIQRRGKSYRQLTTLNINFYVFIFAYLTGAWFIKLIQDLYKKNDRHCQIHL